MTDAASCCTACASGLAKGGASCDTVRSGPAVAAEVSGVALEARVSAVAELSPASPALDGALVPALHTVAPIARASAVVRELAPVRGHVVAPAPPPPGNIALTMEHAQALAAAPQFHQNLALTLEDAEKLAQNPIFRAGISMTLEDSLAFAEASQKNAAIALTTDDALALANSPQSRAGLDLYDHSSPDLMTQQRLSPAAVGAVLRGEHPVFTLGKPGPPGPSKPQTGQFGKPAVTGLAAPSIQTPLWFHNALWTDYDTASSAWGDFVDVGAGGGMVWAVTSDGQLWKLAPGSSRFVEEAGMRAAARVAVLSDGRPVVVTTYGSVEELFYELTYHWQTLWAYPADVVPGTSSTTLPQDIAAGWFTYTGIVAVLGDRVVSLTNRHVVPVEGNAGVRAVAVAADGTKVTRDGKKLPRLWAVGNNGNLYAGDELNPPGISGGSIS